MNCLFRTALIAALLLHSFDAFSDEDQKESVSHSSCNGALGSSRLQVSRSLETIKPSFIQFVGELDSMVGKLKPLKTTIELSETLSLRDSYNKHIEFQIVIGMNRLSSLTKKSQAVMAHEYGHAVLSTPAEGNSHLS